MLADVDVQPMLPVKNMDEACRFYEQKLGLTRAGGQPDVAVVYRCGGSRLCVYRSSFAGTNQGTAALWEVDDVDAVVQDLRRRGVAFEHYDDMSGLTREGDVHRAGGFAVAWFKDPAGNILSVQTRS